MALLDNFLSDEEKKYFETGGEKEGNIAQEQPEDKKPSEEPEVETNQSSVEKILLGDGDTEFDDAEETEAIAQASEGDAPDKTKVQRDYEKAYKTQIHKQKELKQQLEQQSKKSAEAEAALLQLKDVMTRQTAEPARRESAEAAPDINEDPLGYYNYKIRQLESTVAQQNQYLTEKGRHDEAIAQQTAFVDWYKESANNYKAKVPEFSQAYDFLAEQIINERVAGGFTEEQARKLLVEDEIAVASLARRDGVNPAERIYNMAKARGFTKDAPKNSSTKTLASIKKGMDNAKSLKSSGNEPRESEGGIDNIDDMSFKEFDDFWAKLKRQEKRR